MKRIMIIGPVSAGKTTLSKSLEGMENLESTKTQTIQIIGSTIDTPGEYLENRRMGNALSVTALDADSIIFVQDAMMAYCWFAPGQSEMFSCPVIGAVTKIDIADQKGINRADEILRYAGAAPIFHVTSIDKTDAGIEKLKYYLMSQ